MSFPFAFVPQSHPLSLCNTSEDEHTESGFITIVKLEQPDRDPNPCLSLANKVGAKMPPMASTWEVKPMVRERVRAGGGGRVGKSCWEVEKRTRIEQGPWQKGSFGRDTVSHPQYLSLLSFWAAWLCKRCGVFPNLTAQDSSDRSPASRTLYCLAASCPSCFAASACLLACWGDLCFPVSSVLWENMDTENIFCGPAFKNNTVILHWMRHVKNQC